MDPPRTVTIEQNLWQDTLNELQKLRQQNKTLRNQIKRLSAKNQKNQTTDNLRHSLTQSTFFDIHTEQSQNPFKQNSIQKQRSQFKTQMAFWLMKINSKDNQLKGKLSLINEDKQLVKSLQYQEQNQDLQKPQDKVQQKNEQEPKKLQLNLQPPKQCKQQIKMKKNNSMKRKSLEGKQKRQIKLIESICLFGPSQKQIVKGINNQKIMIGSQLLYSSSQDNSESFQVYGEYFYPEGLSTVRNIKQDQVATQVHQVIFRKNPKKQDCSIFMFRGDQNNQQLRVQNPVLSKVNPGKWLIAFFIQFSDFQAIFAEQLDQLNQQKANKSVHLKSEQQNKEVNKSINQCQTERARTNKNIKCQYFKSKYTLCIFTYLPLINEMQKLLSSVLDEIKQNRVAKYANQDKVQQVSIKFFIDQLKKIGSQIHSNIQKIPSQFFSQVQIIFRSRNIKFDMSQNKIDDLLFSGWVHDVIKNFQKEVLYDLYTNMMTQESICFVCQNMHLLTYTIFFFICIMPFPFTYPHPCISKVFNYELLQSPFVVTAGINQSTKWLQENVSSYPKKIFVDLNDEAKIKGKRKVRNIKSQKLKKIFSILYKKLQGNSPMPHIFKKRETIIKAATRQQNQSIILFLRGLQSFYQEQIFNHLPNPAIINFLKDKTDETNETSKVFNILKQIQKYLKECRKHKEKDHFIDSLTQQQIFYVYLGSRYSLD